MKLSAQLRPFGGRLTAEDVDLLAFQSMATEMENMASCERLTAASAGMAEFDWAERCLRQRRRITAKEPLVQYTYRQWSFV